MLGESGLALFEREADVLVYQKLGEGATLRVAPELADPVGSLEVGEHEDVEQLGAWSGAERVQAIVETAVEFVWPHRFGDLAKAR
jgi:hypothetical protein